MSSLDPWAPPSAHPPPAVTSPFAGVLAGWLVAALGVLGGAGWAAGFLGYIPRTQGLLWIIMLIAGVGLILRKEWGRRLGIALGWLFATLVATSAIMAIANDTPLLRHVANAAAAIAAGTLLWALHRRPTRLAYSIRRTSD